MKLELGFSYSQMGYLAAGIQVGFMLSSMISGVLAPKIGELRYILFSMLFCAVCLLSLSLANSPLQAAIVLVCVGFVPAATWTPMVAVIRRFVSFSKRGIVFGFLSGSGGYGAIVNGQFIPEILEVHGWRAIWFWTGIAVLLFTLCSFLLLRLFRIVDNPRPSRLQQSQVAEKTRGLDRQTLRIAVHLWVIMALGAAITISYQTYFTAFIRDHLGADRFLAGQMTLLHGCIGILIAPIIGYIADKTNVRLCFGLVVFNTFVACTLMYLAESIELVVLSAVFFGAAFYPFFALPAAYASKRMEAKTAVHVFAIGNVFVGLGAMLGNTFGGIVLYHFDTLPSVFAGLSLMTILLAGTAFALPKEKGISNG